MIRPVNFSFNAETAVNNAFQVPGQAAGAQENAAGEFDHFVTLLRSKGVDVTVIEDTPSPYTPDSIFPNNWISFHGDGAIVLYPMYAPNRRAERKPHILETLSRKFLISNTIDLTGEENDNRFLEGTGSMVLDRDNKIAYACLSPRTNKTVLERFGSLMGYRTVAFTATDQQGMQIYHTNVMMCVADEYVVICLDAITDPEEHVLVQETIRQSGKAIVPITMDQMNAFAGNMLQVSNASGTKFLVMSSQAYKALTPEQVRMLEKFNGILHAPLDTIETNGGGSARCMMAEIYLEPR
ncbi:hypothetical protein FPE01S_02_08070 [Flavihumibacter petaseus NBRC 106054]|uniref:Amidinotransferase n=2 Tax=Flavihumibacter TaxID=1004301 RepID=A0A0E9N216_9BACT|nr:hypothetical protein FPE01S_02_08070 [Flavihumibacter petaseus NBRC 106054]